ncbi:MAG: DUF4390 domain-containing protein [Georgfuchsia sp.]
MRNLLMLAITLLWVSCAQAASIEPVNASLFPTEDGYALSADFAIDLGPRVEEAVSRGVPLYFNLELDVTRPRRYWVDEHVLGYTLTYRLTFNALTRHYRLGTGGLSRSFDTLSDALRAMGRIAALPVAGKGTFMPDETYQAVLRLSLDHSQLPKPFQLDAIISSDWQIDAKVLRWQFPPTDQDAQ